MAGKFVYNPFTDELDYTNILSSTNYTGADLTDSDGATNRTLTATATLIVVDNQFLHPTTDYTTSGGVITFVNQIFDSQKITVWG